jgi:3-dehydroquinate dehydratase/shikimate dehydrogenase
MTNLAVSIFVHSLEQSLSEAAQAAEHGADLVEYRVDLFTDLDDVRFLVEKSPLPCIVTCRPSWEGGESDLPDQQRIPVLEAASVGGSSYIDVELIAYQRSANLRQKVHFNAGTVIDLTVPREQRKGLIVSSHDFTGRPAKLLGIVSDLNASGADVVKIVWTARTVRDCVEAFEILRSQHSAGLKPTIALCMGEAGLITRILAPKFGAFLTFAALRPEAVTAPGQPTLDDLLNVYRFRSIKPTTAVFGVVGYPVSHSLSPHIHNENFAREGVDAVYVPLLVSPGYESFKAFMETLGRDQHLDLRGLSVTLPHKENAYRYLKEVGGDVDAVAESTGAVNTIRLTSGQLAGISTDHPAIAHCVRLGRAKAGFTPDLTGVRVAVIGAGGTGRTAVATLSKLGAPLTVYNRTLDRAQQLAREFPHTTAAPLEDLAQAEADVFINTTTQGMYPNTATSAWGPTLPKLGNKTVVFDTIYTPLETVFLKQAREHNAVTIPGLEMFAHQAAGQYTFWTGREVGTEGFRARAERELRKRGVA